MKQLPLIELPKLKRYRIKFFGRKISSIGTFSAFEVVIEAETADIARLKLYDTYEHITKVSFDEL